MLIDGESWTGNVIHFASGNTFVGICADAPGNGMNRMKDGTFVRIPNGLNVDYMEIDKFEGATSFDDPIVKEWEKEHAYKERP
jgi:hypothetical protein